MQKNNLVLITNDRKNKRLIYYNQGNQKFYKISHNNSVSSTTLILGPALIPIFRYLTILIGTVIPDNSFFLNFLTVIFLTFLLCYLSYEVGNMDKKKISEIFTEISAAECETSILKRGIREVNIIVMTLIPLSIIGIFMSGIFVVLNINSILSYILFGSSVILGHVVSSINPGGLQKVTENFDEIVRRD